MTEQGLSFLHSSEIATHGNLKVKNVYFFEEGCWKPGGGEICIVKRENNWILKHEQDVELLTPDLIQN